MIMQQDVTDFQAEAIPKTHARITSEQNATPAAELFLCVRFAAAKQLCNTQPHFMAWRKRIHPSLDVICGRSTSPFDTLQILVQELYEEYFEFCNSVMMPAKMSASSFSRMLRSKYPMIGYHRNRFGSLICLTLEQQAHIVNEIMECHTIDPSICYM